jgi:hypothetical protein
MKIIEERHRGFLPRNDEAWEIVGSRGRSSDREQNRDDYGSVAM